MSTRLRGRGRRLAAVLTAGLAALAGGAASGAAAGTVAEPVVSEAGSRPVASYLGAPLRQPLPVDGRLAPQHPFLGGSGTQAHDDGYNSDVYRGAGPRGRDPEVTSAALGRCALVLHNSRGRVLAACKSADAVQLRLLHPTSLKTLVSKSFPGGAGYGFIDHADRVVMSSGGDTIHVVDTVVRGEDALRQVATTDLGRAVGGGSIRALMPDWSGRIWFATGAGVVGSVRTSMRVVDVLDLGEKINNGLAADSQGGVYAVTDRALYRMALRKGHARVDWRVKYDRGSRDKSMSGRSSGTTPTVFTRSGEDYVAIADNADPRIRVLVYRVDSAEDGPMCSVPVFKPDRGATDNSLVSMDKALFVTNNYGYNPRSVTTASPYRTVATTRPGITRIDVKAKRSSCEVAWTNNDIRVPMATVKGSAATGLLYAYEHPAADELTYAGKAAREGNEPDPWYLTALNPRTGKRMWSVLAGYGRSYDAAFSHVSLQNKRAVVGIRGGLVSVRDS